MKPKRWKRIGGLFAEALEREGEARTSFVSEIAEEDGEAAKEIGSLLSAHEAEGGFDALLDAVSGPAMNRFLKLETGDPIGPYRVVREIGSGGTATVYLAHDGKHDRNVAIKVLRPELAASLGVERFLREIEISSRLTHPHILPLFDSGEAEGLLYFVMPYVDGQSLRDRLSQESRLPVAEAIRLTEQICSALSYAHERGIVHRDLKPGNILIAGDQAIVADFGIARALAAAGDVRLTGDGFGVGTPAYMSPEQARGSLETDVRSDVYSLGCVIYEMVGGQTPFGGRTPGGLLAQHAVETAPALRTSDSEIPLYLERAVRRALAKHPDDRFQTPGELAAALTTGTVVARLGRRQRRAWLQRSAAAAVVLAVLWMLPNLVAGARVERIAVLPLANLTNEEGYLIEGVHEALISEIAQLDIPVIARATMAQYAGSTKSIREIARELDVGRIIEGSLFRDGDLLEVTARLYDGDSEDEVWSGSYDGDIPNAVGLYRAFARSIAREVEATVGPDDEARLQEAPTLNPEVYEAYLQGMHLLNQSTEEAFSEALGYFQAAIDENPADPLAYTGLAFAYITLAHGPAPPPDALHLARAAAERAVRLDATLAEGWAALADIRTYLTWEWEGAEEAFVRADELNPSMAMNHYHRAWYLLLFNRFDEAIEEHERARRLDPLTPLHTVWLPGAYWVAGQNRKALNEARINVDDYPGNATALYVLGVTAMTMGETDEAVRAHEMASEINPRWSGALGRTYALAGRTEEARAIVAELEADPSAWNAFSLAEVYAALGSFDEAFEWLAFEPAHGWLPWSRVMPTLAPLRNDPRFESLMQRLNFVE